MALLSTYYFSPNDNARHSAGSDHVCGYLSGEGKLWEGQKRFSKENNKIVLYVDQVLSQSGVNMHCPVFQLF